jgi:acetyl esterase/lipase
MHRPPFLSLSCASLVLLGLLGFASPSGAAPERLLLWENEAPVGDGTFESSKSALTVHPAPKPNGAAVVICPGGGYGGLVTGAEGHGIAEWLNAQGVTGLVLEYRLPKGRAKVPLLDAQRALRLARAHAAEWKIDPHKIGIMGFSAGGHLASTAVTHFDAGNAQAADPFERVGCRPDFGILVYPVISMVESVHGGSMRNLLGPSPSPELIDYFSSEKQVTPQTPPCFLAHALDDRPVPPKNSALFFEALRSHGIHKAVFLELPSGGHGLNGYKGPMWDRWQAQSLEWLAELGMIPRPSPSNAAP